jgi:hypothetical protein
LPVGAVGRGENAAQNDDFTVALAPLGIPPAPGLPLPAPFRQIVDADRDGNPDPTGAELLGPLGLSVDGTIAHHKRVFIHELGHNLGLRHGPFGINGNPNYLSTMNTAFFDGLVFDNHLKDGVPDSTGWDFDADTIFDFRRFHYSAKALPVLNEAALNENTLVDPGPEPTNALTTFTCPPGALPPAAPVVRVDRPVDWDCDRVTGETGANVNNRNINNVLATTAPSAPNEILPGVEDDRWIQNYGIGLLPDKESPTIQQFVDFKSRQQRIMEPRGREWFVQRCANRQRRINFEEHARDTAVSTQYAPGVTFLADDARRPVIVDKSRRNGTPTSSPDHSLFNEARRGPAPLVMTFGEPQRAVRLSVGHAGITRLPRERMQVVLRAFDTNELPMGLLVHELTQSSTGVRESMLAVAVFPDELIKRIEVTFETDLEQVGFGKPKLIDEPVLIDDLEFCERLDETGLKPWLPPQPKFGDLKVTLNVESEAVHQTGTTPEGLPVTTRSAFAGLPVTIDGGAYKTGASISRKEGSKVNVSAPATYSGWTFKYWKHSKGVSLSNGVTSVPLTLLQDGTLTAVYEGRRMPRDPGGRPPPNRGNDCECCKCCEGERKEDPLRLH